MAKGDETINAYASIFLVNFIKSRKCKRKQTTKLREEGSDDVNWTELDSAGSEQGPMRSRLGQVDYYSHQHHPRPLTPTGAWGINKMSPFHTVPAHWFNLLPMSSQPAIIVMHTN
jgi:hypothetical protein